MKIATLGFAAAAVMLASTAQADISATVTGISDYDFRGVSQTADDPALQGSIEWEGESGGYGGVCMEAEGTAIAHWLNSLGVAAFVVNYRHRGRGYGHPAPLLDAQRAIRTVRSRAADLNIDPNRIGVLGFSAGGHLATAVSVLSSENEDENPDFSGLIYPVTTLSHENQKWLEEDLFQCRPARPDL